MCVVSKFTIPAVRGEHGPFKALDRVLYDGRVWVICHLLPMPGDKVFFSRAILRNGSDKADVNVSDIVLI